MTATHIACAHFPVIIYQHLLPKDKIVQMDASQACLSSQELVAVVILLF